MASSGRRWQVSEEGGQTEWLPGKQGRSLVTCPRRSAKVGWRKFTAPVPSVSRPDLESALSSSSLRGAGEARDPHVWLTWDSSPDPSFLLLLVLGGGVLEVVTTLFP